VVLDREGYGRDFFAKMNKRRIACLTYHNTGNDWPRDEFVTTDVRMALGSRRRLSLPNEQPRSARFDATLHFKWFYGAASWTRTAIGADNRCCYLIGLFDNRWNAQVLAKAGEVGSAVAIGKQPAARDAVQTLGNKAQEEAARGPQFLG
jgi:hypothetical protein